MCLYIKMKILWIHWVKLKYIVQINFTCFFLVFNVATTIKLWIYDSLYINIGQSRFRRLLCPQNILNHSKLDAERPVVRLFSRRGWISLSYSKVFKRYPKHFKRILKGMTNSWKLFRWKLFKFLFKLFKFLF